MTEQEAPPTEQESPPAEPIEGDRLYTPVAGETQLTVRAVLVGCLIGAVVTGMNLYLGLKIGWTVGGSLMAAILGFAFFSALRPDTPFSVLEANITQTTGSGAGTMASAAGLVAPIPAMFMLGFDIEPWALMLWSASIAYLGVMFAVPLRRQYVEIEKLRFPTGTATANTIMAMFATAGEALAKARVLLYCGLFAFFYILAAYFVPYLEKPKLHTFIEVGFLITAAKWGFQLYLGPMLFGAGFLIGVRVAASLLFGAIFGWIVLGGMSQYMGWAPHPNPMVIHDPATGMWGARGWILWPGVAIMIGDALMSLAMSWRTFVTAFKGTKAAADSGDDTPSDEIIPNKWWIGGLLIASVGTVVTAKLVFEIPALLSIIAIILSAVLANVAVRSTGETDINPVGGMGKVTQGVFGTLSTSMSTNLMAAGITGAGASQAGDMMQDLKTGYLLGASPRKQFIAQLVGIAAGVLSAVPVFYLFSSAYKIGGEKLPAPAAMAWKAVAQVMAQGFEALPAHATTAMICGLVFGAALPLIKKASPELAKYTPSGLAFGIAFIVPAYYSILMFVGAIAFVFWQRKDRPQSERFVFAVACGLIAGEGLAGIVNAILTMIGVPSLF